VLLIKEADKTLLHSPLELHLSSLQFSVTINWQASIKCNKVVKNKTYCIIVEVALVNMAGFTK